MYNKLIVSFLLFLLPVSCFADYVIKGHFQHISSNYYPKVYLFAIRSVNDLYDAAPSGIINSATISADGTFILTGNNLPKQTALYRLYLTHNKDANALIEVSQTPNFIVLALNPTSYIDLKADSFNSFNDVSILGNELNLRVQNFFSFLHGLNKNSSPVYISSTQTELSARHYADELSLYADTCKDGLISLLAFLNMPGREKIYASDRSLVNHLIEKLRAQYKDAPYLNEIENELAIAKMENNEFVMNAKTGTIIGAAFLFIVLGFILSLLIIKRKINAKVYDAILPAKDTFVEKYRTLTPKEREIASLLNDNLSNKEISNNLCIGLSTVKTHINNIYNKLGVTNRTEFLNISLSYLQTEDQP